MELHTHIPVPQSPRLFVLQPSPSQSLTQSLPPGLLTPCRSAVCVWFTSLLLPDLNTTTGCVNIHHHFGMCASSIHACLHLLFEMGEMGVTPPPSCCTLDSNDCKSLRKSFLPYHRVICCSCLFPPCVWMCDCPRV